MPLLCFIFSSTHFLLNMQLLNRGYSNLTIDGIDISEESVKICEDKKIYKRLICDKVGTNKLDIDDSKNMFRLMFLFCLFVCCLLLFLCVCGRGVSFILFCFVLCFFFVCFLFSFLFFSFLFFSFLFFSFLFFSFLFFSLFLSFLFSFLFFSFLFFSFLFSFPFFSFLFSFIFFSFLFSSFLFFFLFCSVLFLFFFSVSFLLFLIDFLSSFISLIVAKGQVVAFKWFRVYNPSSKQNL